MSSIDSRSASGRGGPLTPAEETHRGARIAEGGVAVVPKSRGRTVLLGATVITLAVCVPLAIAEVVSHFLPITTTKSIMMWPPDSLNPVYRFRPNQRYTFSKGWNFIFVNSGLINNDGWINDQHYDAEARTPLLAVVGDSYVEAMMVPYDSTLHGRLARQVAGRGRVYSFGLSGAPMSEYLAQAAYVRDRYHPDALAAVIVGNDFDESLTRYKSAPLLHYFHEDSSGQLSFRLLDFPDTTKAISAAPSPGAASPPPPASWPRRAASAIGRRGWSLVTFVLARSEFYRYLVQNVGVTNVRQRLRQRAGALFTRSPKPAFVANTRADAESLRVSDSRRATDEFLGRLPAAAGLAPERIVLIVDGVRPVLLTAAYERAVRESYFGVMRAYLIREGRAKGFHVVDMQPRLVARFRRERKEFEWPSDGHWNARGHGEAAAALSETPVVRALFGSAERATGR